MTDYDLCASRRASQGEKHRQNADGHHAGKMNARVTMIILGAAVASADDIRTPHYHSGVFRRYTPGPPKSAGLKLSAAEEQRMEQSAKPEGKVFQLPVTSSSPKGTMRCSSVQDVRAPPNIVWKVLLDFQNYPKFIGGITNCAEYAKRRTMTGGKVICARYTLSVGPLYKLHYNLEHHFEPLQHSMTWHLDHTRTSDVFDSVGYWHVEAKPWGSRVYYTNDSLLPSWIPAAVRKSFTKVAMKSATAQLEPACLGEMRNQERRIKMPKLPQIKLPFA